MSGEAKPLLTPRFREGVGHVHLIDAGAQKNLPPGKGEDKEGSTSWSQSSMPGTGKREQSWLTSWLTWVPVRESPILVITLTIKEAMCFISS